MIRDFLEIERRDGVAVLWLDEKDRAVNTISPNALDAFEQAFEELEQDESVRAAVIISRKKGSFIAGADLDVLKDAETPEDAAEMSRRGHLLIRKVSALTKPVVAAIHGPAMGGGLEVALACTYRVATEGPPTRFALPEVMLGLLPGGGGTQLLPRLIGLQEALPMLLTGKNVFPRKAKKIGLVDMLTHQHNLLHAAVSAARDIADGKLKIERSKSMTDRALEATPVGRRIVYKKASEGVQKETRGNYPAPPLILECVKRGMEDGLQQGFRAESEHFGNLVFTPEHRALVGLFRGKQKADKNPFDGARDVRVVGVLGGGLMGGGIAEVTAVKDREVRVKDATLELASRAQADIYKNLQKKVKRRQMTQFEADTALARVVPVDDYRRLAQADVVIEAVPEDLDLKREVLAEVEAATADHAIFATNTSSIPIAEIAQGSKRPERVVGMHYFSPVPKRPLLEVIRKDDTPEDVLATVTKLGLRQGKSVIVVRDGPGFYTTRILAVFMNEAAMMVENGADARAMDEAMKDWGFPMGPFEVMDLVGLDVAAKISPVLAERMEGRDLPISDLPKKMLDADMGGQKTGKGFYIYEEKNGRKKKESFNDRVYEIAGVTSKHDLDRRGIQERLGLLMVNEAMRCLEEGILESPVDGDIGAVFGLGFPPFRGGPFRFADEVGAGKLVERLERLAERHGERFAPAGILVEHARENRRFHD